MCLDHTSWSPPSPPSKFEGLRSKCQHPQGPTHQDQVAALVVRALLCRAVVPPHAPAPGLDPLPLHDGARLARLRVPHGHAAHGAVVGELVTRPGQRGGDHEVDGGAKNPPGAAAIARVNLRGRNVRGGAARGGEAKE